MVVTDLQEPLVLVHRRLIRRRSVLLVIWILGWAATGFVYERAWLALLILAVTGPALWMAVWIYYVRRAPGRRVPVGRRALTAPTAPLRNRLQTSLTGRGAPGAGAGR